MKDREVARFIVAPSGYGKSYLALEYAETIRSWTHTFWVRAQSPCFMRDLDEGVLSSCILEFDPEANLVVFDDLPLLDAGRQERFSSQIDMLLSEGCEVLVTCSPACDIGGSLQSDRLRVGPGSLLLDDEELDATRSIDEQARIPASQICAASRVPLLAWSHEQNKGELFAKRSLSEELPHDMLLVMASALVLRRGTLSNLVAPAPFEKAVIEEMADDYPHLGLSLEADAFEAPSVEMEDLATPLQRRLPQLVKRSSCDTVGQLVGSWASCLLRGGDAPRACELVQEVYPREQRAAWAFDNASELVRQACFASLFKLIKAQKNVTGDLRIRLEALEALCRRQLGDEDGALECAKKSAFNEKAPQDARTLELLLVAHLNAGVLSSQACKTIEQRVEKAKGREVQDRSKWELLEGAWCARLGGVGALSRLWKQYVEAKVSDDVLYLSASWLFELYTEIGRDLQYEDMRALEQVERHVRNGLLDCALDGGVDYYVVSAGLSMEEAHAYGLVFKDGALEAASLVLLRQVEMSILSQRRFFEQDMRMERARNSDWVLTHPGRVANLISPSLPEAPRRTVPLLTLKMFGCFEASIGGDPLDYKLFRKQNTRALLVMLAVNQGREISRDVIAEAIWPRSTLKVARKNFYTVWSNLRKALTLSDGTCPYLIRHRYGCSLDERYVRSDVGRCNEICRELLFSSPNIDHWSLLFAEIDRDFSSELMPADTENALIVQARNDYRTRLVDALVAATISVVDADNPQWGVWFARAAIHHDDTREDAYVALMRAQIAGNQRTAAMMTYLKCRRVLSDKLGIDPSPETTALYESLLDADS